MLSKACFKCGCEKPLDGFYRQSSMKDGRSNKCVECTKVDVRANRAANSDYYRQYDRDRSMRPDRVAARAVYAKTDAYKESHKKACTRQGELYPQKKVARFLFGNALRDGRVQKMRCLVCGADDTEAHHPDYSAPLDVVWLCHAHHVELHRMARELIRAA